jgi:ATP-dependent DNA helicase UvrD/PcrA
MDSVNEDGAQVGEPEDLFAAPPVEAPWLPEGVTTPKQTQAAAEDLLEGLNPAQRTACLHGDGPLLILAGPGSGKTRVITRRIAHLVSARGVAPQELIAITFTNKAAREMRERVQALLPEARGLWVSTFHSSCARILRRDIEALNGLGQSAWTRDFTIYDTSDKHALLREILKELNYDAQRFRPPVIGGWISNLKNSEPDDGELAVVDDGEGMQEEVFGKVRNLYEQRLRERNALDFDDLLLKVLELFDQHPGVRDAYSRRFRHVLVDEYQDTNRVQYRLVCHLASFHGNLAVCGDPDQSIYGWRGADIRNILDFEHDFPGPVIVRLEQNYRSTGNILAAASAVIANNSQRKHKDLWTEGEAGEKLTVLECGDENEEGREVALQCLSVKARGGDLSKVAVFYRMNFMQRALESALRLARVPYQIVAGLEFYDRREVKDLVGYLRLIMNPADDGAFGRVVNSPMRGVGAKSIERLTGYAHGHGIPLLEAARSEQALAMIRGRAKKGLAEFAACMERLAPLRETDASIALRQVLEEIDTVRWFAGMDDGSGTLDREANVDEVLAHATEYDRMHPEGGLRGFLEEIALVSDADGLEESDLSVKLMTLHAAKGLEFDTVFMIGCEQDLLPHARALEEDPVHGIEEERRLFYVGLTRARKQLRLTRAVTRMHFGETRWQQPSEFLDELPPEVIEGGSAASQEEQEAAVLGEYDADEGLVVGMLVEHGHFGVGTIEQLTGRGIDARATVRFARHGTKQLLLQYAKLKVLP